MRPGAAAGDGHDPELTALLTRQCRDSTAIEQVEILDALQRRPVDAYIDHWAKRFSDGLGQIGKFTCNRNRVRPPRPVEAAAQDGGQREADRTSHASPVDTGSHEPQSRTVAGSETS
jgi:hypothetical protein